MGLYGAITKDAAPGVAHFVPGQTIPTPNTDTTYANEVTLFYSDIDPDHNAAVSAGDAAYTPIEYHPTWFLINGEPYQDTVTQDLSTDELDALNPLETGENTLVRFISAASENHVPVFQGLYGTIYAEDGIPYSYHTIETPSLNTTYAAAPVEQYSVGLPPLKTKDVIINPSVPGRYAVYDGNGYMTNPTDPTNETSGDSIGGMLRFLSFAQGNIGPIVTDDVITLEFTADMTGANPPVPVVVDVLANDSDPDGTDLTITQIVNLPINQGAIELGRVDCDNVSTTSAPCTFTPTPDVGTDLFTEGTGAFQYTVADLDGATAIGNVTVNMTLANSDPIAVDDAYSVDEDQLLTVDGTTLMPVLDNDTDADATDILTPSVVLAPANGTLILNTVADEFFTGPAGAFTYQPDPDFDGIDTFTYLVNDGTVDSVAAIVTITVNPINDAPVAIDDPNYTTVQDTTLVVASGQGVLINDTDVDTPAASLLWGGLGATTTANGVLTPDGAGGFTYAPNAGFVGTDTFSYIVNDGVDNSANEGLVTITVTAPVP
ncbi:MAG: Ig-like domain-containing protein [Candidatus Thiodiazotropha sp.]